ncbi:MAG: hypothetical protein PHV82_01180 [Victivallaceae bacterium]|nr:hypothetical protein [Victivallaceae bacterium]
MVKITNSYKIKLSGRQGGQAVIEMCVCLIPILVILLGMVFISGLCISNIRTFVSAKGNAELLSRSDDTSGGEGDNIYCWNYGEDEDEDGYPFTADDQPVYLTQAGDDTNLQTIIDRQLNESLDSEAVESGEYAFLSAASLPYITDNNFAQSLPDSMVAAAELVSGKANSSLNNVFTVDSDEFSSDEINSLNASFSRLFGLETGNINLRNMRANTVYYPVTPTSRTGTGSDESQDIL